VQRMQLSVVKVGCRLSPEDESTRIPTPRLTLFSANSSRIKGPATHSSERWLLPGIPDSLTYTREIKYVFHFEFNLMMFFIAPSNIILVNMGFQ